MSVTTERCSQVDTFRDEVKSAVDTELDRLLGQEDVHGARLHEAMRYCALTSGKRVRPALMAATTEAFDRPWRPILPAMCAVEMIHVSSLVLDDLPCMDDGVSRHGRNAAHRVFGMATASMAAIELLNRAFALLASVDAPAETRVALVSEANRTVGDDGLIGGQLVELASREAGRVDAENLAYIYERKTAVLLVAAVRIAGRLGGGTDEQLDALSLFAGRAGVAYQIRDDLLEGADVPSAASKVSRVADVSLTAVGVHGREGAERLARRYTEEGIAALDVFGDKAERLVGLARWLLGRRF